MDGDMRTALDIHLDCHTLHRLEALLMLRAEQGHRGLSEEALLRQALMLGLNLMLGETLLKQEKAS